MTTRILWLAALGATAAAGYLSSPTLLAAPVVFPTLPQPRPATVGVVQMPPSVQPALHRRGAGR